MAYLIPLKLKYRTPGKLLKRAGVDPIEGTLVYSAGSHKSRSSNAGKAQKMPQGGGPRRRQGLGSVGE